MGRNLVTLSEFKAYKGITNAEDDVRLSSIIASASSFVKTYCDRSFIDYNDKDFVEYFNGIKYNKLYLKEFPLLSITSVEYFDSDLTYKLLTESVDYFVDIDNSCLIATNGISFLSYSPAPFKSIKVTYKGGYTELPDDLKIAVLDLVEYYRTAEYTPRKTFSDNTIENVGFRQGSSLGLPPHIDRILGMYRG